MTDAIAALERDLGLLVANGQAIPIGKLGSLELRADRWTAAAHSRPAFFDPREPAIVNVDNVLLLATTVADEPAIGVAIAHGNYKDNGCAFASAAAVVAAASELSKPLLAEADVGPALQRAMFAADDRIQQIQRAPLSGAIANDFLATCMGKRKDLSGIGASVIAAVLTTKHVFLAHAGENRALLVRPGADVKELVVPHTLANTPEGKKLIKEDGSERPFMENVVVNIVGYGDVRFELTRAPIASGDRIVVGNAGLAHVTSFDGTTNDIADFLSRENEYVPATLAIVDLASG